jgi:hypothetical protein
MPSLPAKPHSIEAPVKIAMPARNIRVRPMRSPSRPRDGHDRRVEDQHQLTHAHHRQRQPPLVSCLHDRHHIMMIW